MRRSFPGSVRVLLLRRQTFGGIATYTRLLVDALDRVGIEAVVDDAEEWIPNKTGPAVDRQVSKAVRAAAQGFDLVHAFGYRTAWACSAAFRSSEPWVYTAHDMPKTVHSLLIERLNEARAGVCSSSGPHNMLSSAGAKRLKVIKPGLPSNRRVLDRDESRAMLAIPEDRFQLVTAGRFCVEHSLQTVAHVAECLPYEVRLTITGRGELEDEVMALSSEKVTVTTEPFAQQALIAAADLLVVPSVNAGFTFSALEAMYQGVAPVLRRIGGHPDLAEDHQTGFFYDTDEELLDVLGHLCYKREECREVGRAARHRALAEFDIARTAEELKKVYGSALG
ncbi:MAG TPA: glycosyltransferase family 4 protein [Fimbriimonadaceae bacterium]|nr:glycosyltransferase family 4 protein [Fimbriimonadaceae bacterium]